jgi:hypothetical protein
MLIKLLDVLGRTALLLMTLLLSKKVKLRVVCWAMNWLAKKGNGNPLRIEYNSGVGTLSLTVTRAFAQLTWHLTVQDEGKITGAAKDKEAPRRSSMSSRETEQ